MAYHLNGRRFDIRVLTQESRTLRVGRKDDGISVRDLVIHNREVLPAPAGTGAEPGGHDGRCQLLRDVR